MIRIAHLIIGLGVGGAETILSNLVSHRQSDQLEHIVISLTDIGELGKIIEKQGIRVYALNIKPNIRALATIVKLVFLLRKLKPQILQTWLYHADLMGVLIKKISGVKKLAWNIRCSSLRKEDHPGSLFLIIRLLVKMSGFPDVLVVNSKSGLAVHKELGYKAKRWELIQNGFDTNKFKPSEEARLKIRKELGLPADIRLIGLVARYHAMKDHSTFLKVVSKLKKYNNLCFILVGRGIDKENDALANEIEALGIQKKVRLFGERSDIPTIMAALDILVSSSYGEGFPNVIGEAMSCGIPCVATNVGDSELLLGNAGKIVPPRDPSAMADAINGILSYDKDKYQRKSEEARSRIKKLFSTEVMVQRFENMYMELAKDLPQ